MTEVLQKLVVDCSSGEATYVPLTPEEISQREADAQAYAAEQAAREAEAAQKATARAALLKKLGITAEEAALLLG
jgi:hypothetical protein